MNHMPISYGTKAQLLSHLFEQEHWKNNFDAEWLLDEQRRSRGTGGQDNRLRETPRPLRENLLHSITFAITFADLHDLSLVNAIKVVLAFDMGLDPSLPTLNALKSIRRGATVSTLSEVEKPWRDITDFQGSQVGTPRGFGVRKQKDRFVIAMGTDEKQHILSCRNIFLAAADEPQTHASATLESAKVKPETLINILNDGQTDIDQYGHKWRSTLLVSTDRRINPKTIRDTLQNRLHLERNMYYAINVAPDTCLVAALESSFQKAATRYEASTALMKHITSGGTDTDLIRECLKNGADLKYIDPSATRNAKTFSSVMRAHACIEGLIVMRETQGIAPTLDTPS